MRKQVAFIANSLVNAYKFQQVLAELDVEIAAGSTARIRKLLQPGARRDLVVFEALGSACSDFAEVASLAERLKYPLLAIVDDSTVGQLKFPPLNSFDFVMENTSRAEFSARVRRLLGYTATNPPPRIVTAGSMSINLDTYQVTVADEPMDFTYLEYALLAFLVQHPNRTFSRNELLRRVWGFDYAGGMRTVDVHVRRIRSKLGPSLAQHLETIRGVGYFWNSN